MEINKNSIIGLCLLGTGVCGAIATALTLHGKLKTMSERLDHVEELEAIDSAIVSEFKAREDSRWDAQAKFDKDLANSMLTGLKSIDDYVKTQKKSK